jgi:subtilisin-like proprotein convertase family protein
MHKDRLILLLLLAAFVLVGASCDAPWDNDDDDKAPLPDRAFASTPLLRAYYNTNTMPKHMRSIKIPEGKKFDDNELTIEFQMGGTAVVDEVRTHLFIMPPAHKSLEDVELQCRCIAPNGTRSAWKPVDASSSSTFDPQTEVLFLFEFIGLISDGTWRIQLRDPVADEDGRCLLRNASLHINKGEPNAPGGATSASETLDLATGRYGVLPQASGKREPFDPGHFGVGAMLRNEFTFAAAFTVRAFRLRFGLYVQDSHDETVDTILMLTSPTGNWLAFALPDPADSVDFDTSKLLVYDFTVGSLPNSVLMNLNGEPSAGTWTLYMIDTKKDNNVAILTTDEANGGFVVADGAELTLELIGVS